MIIPNKLQHLHYTIDEKGNITFTRNGVVLAYYFADTKLYWTSYLLEK